MLGSIAALIIVVWYYNGAKAMGKNPINGAIVGFLIYFVPAIIWTLLVTPSLRDIVEHQPSLLLGLIVRYGFVVVGAGCAIWFRLKVYSIQPEQL